MSEKDWVGNANSIFKTLGSSHHTLDDREVNDFYATCPSAAHLLLDVCRVANDIWEPACGQGHLSKVFTEYGHNVKSTDLINRGFGLGGVDFLKCNERWHGDIVTNPPYKYGLEFIKHALDIVDENRKVCMFLKVQFMEGKARKKLFIQYPPHTIYVSSSRINCAKNGDFEGLRTSGGSAVAYAWYVWVKGFNGTTSLKWIN